VQEALPRSTKQEEDLGTPNTAQKRQKGVVSKADVSGEGIRHQVYTPSFPIFSISSSLMTFLLPKALPLVLSLYKKKPTLKR
jgi:hypothetical protein